MLRTAAAPTSLLAAIVLQGALPAQEQAERFEAGTFTSPEHGELPYRLFVPEGAGEDGARFPLVVFLHGAGERGSDNRRQLRHGAGAFVEPASQERRPCFVLAPQCPRRVWWDVDQLLQLVRQVIDERPVDRERVYVTGLSMGGYATWHLIGRAPELFAAAVPVCGGGPVETAPRLVGLPIWAFHGAADHVVSVEESRKMVAAIREAGGAPKYTEYPGVRHDSWTRTYADQDVHAWMFRQRRAPRPAGEIALRDGDRVVFFGDSITQAGAHGGGYIRLFEADLARQRDGAAIELIGAGISGNRVPDLLARVERDVLEAKPSVVVVYIGINDVWHWSRDRGTEKGDFDRGLRELVRRIAGAGARVVLCTPSVIGEKTDGTNEFDAMLEEYARITRKVAADTGAALLDLRRQFLAHLREHNPDNLPKGVLTGDGVHLNAAGNRFVADRMLEALGLRSGAARTK